MKILVVDDNPTNRKLAEQALSMSGHEVVEAVNGEEGVNKAVSENPDVILMDIQMPGIDGIEAMKQIRSQDGGDKVPVLALTAYAMKGDRERLLEDGFDDYISKPFSIAELIEKVGKYSE